MSRLLKLPVKHSWLLRCSTARGSSSRFSLAGLTKVKLVSLFVSLKVPLKLKIKYTCLISLSHYNQGSAYYRKFENEEIIS